MNSFKDIFNSKSKQGPEKNPEQKPKADLSKYDYLFKIMMVGFKDAGKSNLLLRFADNTFTNTYISTIGVDFKMKTVETRSGNVKFQCWDTYDIEAYYQERSYSACHGIILAVDLTNSDKDYLNNILKKIVPDIERRASSKISIYIACTKSDLKGERKISKTDLENFIKKMKDDHGLDVAGFMETSAKDGTNVEELFTDFAEHLVYKLDEVNNNTNQNLPKKKVSPEIENAIKQYKEDFIHYKGLTRAFEYLYPQEELVDPRKLQPIANDIKNAQTKLKQASQTLEKYIDAEIKALNSRCQAILSAYEKKIQILSQKCNTKDIQANLENLKNVKKLLPQSIRSPEAYKAAKQWETDVNALDAIIFDREMEAAKQSASPTRNPPQRSMTSSHRPNTGQYRKPSQFEYNEFYNFYNKVCDLVNELPTDDTRSHADRTDSPVCMAELQEMGAGFCRMIYIRLRDIVQNENDRITSILAKIYNETYDSAQRKSLILVLTDIQRQFSDLTPGLFWVDGLAFTDSQGIAAVKKHYKSIEAILIQLSKVYQLSTVYASINKHLKVDGPSQDKPESGTSDSDLIIPSNYSEYLDDSTEEENNHEESKRYLLAKSVRSSVPIPIPPRLQQSELVGSQAEYRAVYDTYLKRIDAYNALCTAYDIKKFISDDIQFTPTNYKVETLKLNQAIAELEKEIAPKLDTFISFRKSKLKSLEERIKRLPSACDIKPYMDELKTIKKIKLPKTVNDGAEVQAINEPVNKLEQSIEALEKVVETTNINAADVLFEKLCTLTQQVKDIINKENQSTRVNAPGVSWENLEKVCNDADQLIQRLNSSKAAPSQKQAINDVQAIKDIQATHDVFHRLHTAYWPYQYALERVQKDYKAAQELHNKYASFCVLYREVVEFAKSLPFDENRKLPPISTWNILKEDAPVPQTYTACQDKPLSYKNSGSKTPCAQALAALHAWATSERVCLENRFKKMENRIKEIEAEIKRNQIVVGGYSQLDLELLQLVNWQNVLKQLIEHAKDVSKMTTVNIARPVEKIVPMLSTPETLQIFTDLRNQYGQINSIDDYFTALHTQKNKAQSTTLSDLKVLISQAEAILGTKDEERDCKKFNNNPFQKYKYGALKLLDEKLHLARECVTLLTSEIGDKEKKKQIEKAASYLIELSTCIPDARAELYELRKAVADKIPMYNRDSFERHYYKMHIYELIKCRNEYIKNRTYVYEIEPIYKEAVKQDSSSAYAEIHTMLKLESIANEILKKNEEDSFQITVHIAEEVSDSLREKIKALSRKFNQITLPTSSSVTLKQKADVIKAEIDELSGKGESRKYHCIDYVQDLKTLSAPSKPSLLIPKQLGMTQAQQEAEIQQQLDKKKKQEQDLEVLKQVETVFLIIQDLDRKLDALITEVKYDRQLEVTKQKDEQAKRETELAKELTDAVDKLTVKLKEAETTVSAFFDKTTYADLKKLAAMVEEVNRHIELLQEESPGKTAEEKRSLISKTNVYINMLTTLLPLAKKELDLSAHVTQPNVEFKADKPVNGDDAEKFERPDEQVVQTTEQAQKVVPEQQAGEGQIKETEETKETKETEEQETYERIEKLRAKCKKIYRGMEDDRKDAFKNQCDDAFKQFRGKNETVDYEASLQNKQDLNAAKIFANTLQNIVTEQKKVEEVREVKRRIGTLVIELEATNKELITTYKNETLAEQKILREKAAKGEINGLDYQIGVLEIARKSEAKLEAIRQSVAPQTAQMPVQEPAQQKENEGSESYSDPDVVGPNAPLPESLSQISVSRYSLHVQPKERSEKESKIPEQEKRKKEEAERKAALSDWNKEKTQVERTLREYKKTLAKPNSMCNIKDLKKQAMELDKELHRKVQSLDAASIQKHTAELKQKRDALLKQTTTLQAMLQQEKKNTVNKSPDNTQNIINKSLHTVVNSLQSTEGSSSERQPSRPNPLTLFTAKKEREKEKNKEQELSTLNFN